jgi:hypothetical protein
MWLIPKSKHASIVAMLSASFVPGLANPAIGQQPKAMGEIRTPVLPSGRSSILWGQFPSCYSVSREEDDKKMDGRKMQRTAGLISFLHLFVTNVFVNCRKSQTL